MKQIDNIKVVFIHHYLTTTIGLTTYKNIHLIQFETNMNSATVYSGRRNVNIGMLQASILKMNYSTFSGGVYFDILIYPDNFSTPTGIGMTGPTAMHISDTINTHEEKIEEFHTL